MIREVRGLEMIDKDGENRECEVEDELEEKMREISENARDHGIKCVGEKVIDVLTRYTEVFSNKPGKARDFVGRIEIVADKPVVQKSYPVPHKKKKKNGMQC